MTINLSETTVARLTEAASKQGMDAEELLIALLDQQEALQENGEDTISAINEGIAEAESGMGRSFDDYVAEQRAIWAARGL